MPTFLPNDMIGRHILLPNNQTNEKIRAKIVERLQEHEDQLLTSNDMIKFCLEVGETGMEEIYSYSDLIDYLNKETLEQATGEQLFMFKDIVGHQGPLKPGDKSYKGSAWNVLVGWEDGSETYEPLKMIGADSPVVVAKYGQRNNLLDQPGWKRFKHLAKQEKKIVQML